MYLYVIFTLVLSSRRAAIARNAKVGRMFSAISLYTIIVWSMYPIVWALGEGTQRISVNAEIIWFAVVCTLWGRELIFSSISWLRAFLEDGYWFLIWGFRRAMFRLPGGGSKDLGVWKERLLRGGGCWMRISGAIGWLDWDRIWTRSL